MKKNIMKYLQFLPFAICLGSLIIYLVYTIYIKANKAVIVTDKLISTLKIYLIIALVSLFIGLLIILLKKIFNLVDVMPKIKLPKKEKVQKLKAEKKKEQVIEIKNNEETKNIQEEIQEVIKEEVKEEIKEVKKERNLNDNNKEYIFKLEGVSCPSCKGLLAKDAAICPHCGILFDNEILRILDKYYKKETKKKKSPVVILANVLLTILFIILILLVVNLIINKAHENKTNIMPSAFIEKVN